MATRFAVATGNWSNGATWDNGAVPSTTADIAFLNGFTVTADANLTVATLSNAVSNVAVPNILTPAMTSNNAPSGQGVVTCFASSNNSTAFNAFAQDSITTQWTSATTNTGTVGVQFTSGKVVKKYAVRAGSGSLSAPRTWTLEGSNDGLAWTVLETVAASGLGAAGLYQSATLANVTSYTYYQLNITAVATAGNAPQLGELELTESTAVNGITAGGVLAMSVGGVTANFTTLTQGTSQNVITTSNGSATTVNINSVNDITVRSTVAIIGVGGAGTQNITAPTFNTAAGGTTLSKTGSGITNVVGNLTASNTSSLALNVTGGTLNLTGNITPGTITAQVCSMSAGTLNVTGTITTGTSIGISATGGTLTINGNLTSGSNYCVSSSSVSPATINGTLTSGGTPAVFLSNASANNVLSGPFVNVLGVMAVYAQKIFLTTSPTSWVYTTSGAANRTLYTNDQVTGFPAANDVRSGTTYGVGGALTGTAAIPSPAVVLLGNPVDATTGTYTTTPAAIVAEMDANSTKLTDIKKNTDLIPAVV